MKLLNRKRGWLLPIFVLGLIAVTLADEPIENLRVRLDCYPDGKVKTELFAKIAQVDKDGTIVASGVVLKRFMPDGKIDVEIDAEDCTINQERQTASSTNSVVLHHAGMKVSGDGFVWDGDKSKITITKNARVELPVKIVEEKGALKNVLKK